MAEIIRDVNFLGEASEYLRTADEGVVGLLAYDVCAPLSEEEYDKWLYDVHYHDLMSNPFLEKINLHTVNKNKKARLSSGDEVKNNIEFYRLAILHFKDHESYTKYLEYFQANAIPPPRTPAGKSAFKFYLMAEAESITKIPAKPAVQAPTTPCTVLIVGSSGNIGQELVKQLGAYEGVTVVQCSRSGQVQCDIYDVDSVKGLDKALPNGIDHVVVCCGASVFGPMASFDSGKWTDQGVNKLMAVSRFIMMLANGEEVKCLKDGGSITVTAGLASRTVNKMWPSIAANNAGLEAFIKSAGIEPARGVRVNGVSPALVTESAVKAGMKNAQTVDAAEVAAAYIPLMFGSESGMISDVGCQVAFKTSHHKGQKDGVKESGGYSAKDSKI